MTPYQSAIKLLSHKEYSSMQLREKLQGRGFENEEIEECLQKLKSENYLNDQRFCESYLRYCIRKGWGFHKAKAGLNKYGISVNEDQYEDQLRELKLDLSEQIEGLILKKIQKATAKQLENPFALKAKIFRFLASRGFSGEENMKLINKHLN